MATCLKPSDADDSRSATHRAVSASLMEGRQVGGAVAGIQVLAVGDESMLLRACVDCSLITGRFCDGCCAADRIPSEQWADNQMTPLCSRCDNEHGACHFCRRAPWCEVRPTSSQRQRGLTAQET